VALACQYPHAVQETYIDVVFGTWDRDDANDHITFGCRIEGQEPGAKRQLVDAAAVFGDNPLYGAKLSRDQAQLHPLVGEFWQVVELVAPSLRAH
jgi:hypothetical protein